MIRTLLASLLALSLWGADDGWKKVRDLKTGTELRIVKAGERQPLVAQFADANDENLIVILKNEQVAIPKEKIDRIDFRPPQTGSRVKAETKTQTDTTAERRGRPNESRVPGSSTSGGLSFGGKPGFETVYRRTAAQTDPRR